MNNETFFLRMAHHNQPANKQKQRKTDMSFTT